MANAAFFRLYPLEERFSPLPMPKQQDLIAKGYLLPSGVVAPRAYAYWYAGDYDSAAWLYGQLLRNWDDPQRGSIPIGWAVDSELSLRFPLIFKYLYETRTVNDFFIAGDSGAGYLNPTELYSPRFSGLPSAGDAWTRWNYPWYRQFGLTFTGFLINGVPPETREAEHPYAGFSYNGVTEQADGVHPTVELRDSTLPVFHEANDIVNMNATVAAATMCHSVDPRATGPQFMMYRTILESAGLMHDIVAALATACPIMQIVDPHVAAYLARLHLGGNNDNIATYLADTIPPVVAAGSNISALFTVRNDGWNVLSATTVALNITIVGPAGTTVRAAHEEFARVMLSACRTTSTAHLYDTWRPVWHTCLPAHTDCLP